MTKQKLHIVQKILSRMCWVLLGIGTIVLLGAAMNKKSLMLCKKVEISISGAHNNIFIDEKDVDKILHDNSNDQLTGKPVKDFDLSAIEYALEKNDWIKKAELYFDNNQVLWVNIMEREPVARIFTNSGQSFYIDSSNARIPLSEKFSARLPIFTGYNDSLSTKADTLLLTDIKNISEYIVNDPFWMAEIDQVDITKNRTFEMVPKIGNQTILFGNGDKYAEKFRHLFLFYRDVLSKTGWNKYSTINVEYVGQIISVKRGAGEVKMDSLKTAEIMNNILQKAQMQIADSTGIQLAQKDDPSQQVVPLVSPDLPDENIYLGNHQKFELAGNTMIKKDSSAKKTTGKDSVKNVTLNAVKFQDKRVIVPAFKKPGKLNKEKKSPGIIKKKNKLSTEY